MTVLSTPRGRQAIVTALRAYGSGSSRLWMSAADLARSVGAGGPRDPQLLADVLELEATGVVRLMADSRAAGSGFYEAMLVPFGGGPLPAAPKLGW